MTYFCGIDPGSIRAAACLLHEDGTTLVQAFEMDKRADLPARLAQLDHDLTVWLTHNPQPTVTVVEHPGVGPTSNPATLMAAGVCLATAFAVCPCPTFELLNSQWRARTPLGGAAKKDAIVAWAGREIRHCFYTPNRCPYGDACADCRPASIGEDEAMALGCAWAARELHRAYERSARMGAQGSDLSTVGRKMTGC